MATGNDDVKWFPRPTVKISVDIERGVQRGKGSDGRGVWSIELREEITSGSYGDEEYEVFRSVSDGGIMVRFRDEEWHVPLATLLKAILLAVCVDKPLEEAEE